MSYKIPNIPSPKAYIEELADFWELEVLKTQSRVGHINISKAIGMGGDELSIDGWESEEDEIDMRLDEVYEELSRRKWLFEGYPFEVDSYSLVNKNHNDIISQVYLFLLLATRHDMKTHKVLGTVDATQTFEYLSALVAGNYLGSSANSFVFGTGESGNFEDRVGKLIKKLKIEAQFKNPNRNHPTKKDDGVDVVVWKEFADQSEGKLIAFGQCKTGTSWRDSIHRLNPSTFCENWLTNAPVLKPIPMVFLTDTLNKQRNYITEQRGKLFFNRFRIMEYLPKTLPENIKDEIKTWTDHALEILQKG